MQDSRAFDLLIAKITLEDELARPMARVLGGYVNRWADSAGNLPFQERFEFQDTLRRVLERHYARTVAVVLGHKPEREEVIERVALNLHHAEKLRARAHANALRIITSLDRELADTLIRAGVDTFQKMDESDEIETKKDGFSVSVTGRFKETARAVWEKVRRGMRRTANAETEETAEEAQYQWVRQRHANSRILKAWVTMGDEKVRHSHVAAGERYNTSAPIPVDQPFELAGGRVMMPGDTSLGVSMREIYNCRCQAVYFAQTPEGLKPLDLGTPRLPAKRPWRRGDEFGKEIPIRATEKVTLNGRTRARVVLGDNRTIATMTQPSPSVVNINVGGRTVARAEHASGRVTRITIDPAYRSLDIERLVRDSVEHSHGRR